ncbi:putative 2-aminoethylphosphonate ABC transporter permease subunit [Desulfovibrio sp. TomC]|uniref:putative 2-aminoethylphosphonate ABC transporter permease subunit n=1 Tax=Desulfovibrio sp. TomC TaxID=1562888 RepID=UPI00057392F5|nr:putative 2-aminoethylphosphonate ABC transporter permease subunit [Desulfovibrio sp. TomC]KHK00629.1 Ferric iron ABC transporter, permease protein [Desulfovibrio sp. TomC]
MTRHAVLSVPDQSDWREPFFSERRIRTLLLLGVVLWLGLAVVLPLGQLLAKSLYDGNDAFVGLANFRAYFANPALSRSLANSLRVALATTALAVPLGFAFAYGLTRTAMPGKGFFRGLAMAPLFAPTLLYGITLIYLFGRKGLVTTGFFGFFSRVLGVDAGCDIGLYGPVGIVISETIFTFPQAMLILSIALRTTDARLYEAARSLGASPARIFFTVTLPGVKYGLLSAVFVCFILSFTDFGAPKVVGGPYNVLATDIYKHVIGQQNFAMGATVGVVLLFPTLLAFFLDRLAQRRQASLIVARAVPLPPCQTIWVNRLYFVFCSCIAFLLITFLATALFASLVRVWPYDLSLSLRHFRFGDMGGGGYAALGNSMAMAVLSAVIGTAATFGSAYLVEKTQGASALRQTAYFLAMVPLALPGLVIGLAYIFFFNAPGWRLAGVDLPNPVHWLYGTMGILVLANVVHFYSVCFLTATTALKQLDKEFEAVSESMAVPFYKTFWRVTVPVCLPAVLEIAQFLFVNAMATVSAVIFLYSADIPLASVAVANMDDAGDTAPAAAMSVCIVAVSILARLLSGALAARLSRRSQRWLAP